jgi:hypothetical protein
MSSSIRIDAPIVYLRLSPIGYRLSDIGYRLSALGDARIADR